MIKQFIAATILGLGCASLKPVLAADGPYHFLKEIPIGGDGGWDYLSIDETGRRLYVSHATKVVVVDLDHDAVAGEITNTPGVHGIAVAPELGKGFTSNGRENKSSVVDLKTLATLSRLDTGEGPDAILYESGQREVYVFNGRSQSATVIDARDGKVMTTIPLGGRPEFPSADPGAGRVYDDLEDKSEIAVIDTKKHEVTAHWPVAPAEEPSGMAIDTAHHRIFVGCGNKVMEMIDSETGRVVGSVPIGDGVDANAFDPGTQYAFASCRDGTVTVAHEDGPDKLVVVQTLATQRGSRTMALDPKTHRIYLAAAKFEAPAEAPPGEARQRPKMVPGTFKILVYGMN